MRKMITLFLFLVPFSLIHGQGIHFSQYFNAPLLLNPANTALMPEDDYRTGINYRDQWAQIPAPFKTFSAFTDFKLLKSNDATNWLGIGAVFYNDKAGNGDLSLTKFQLNLAYHLQLGFHNMLSIGVGAGYVQRSVNFSKLTYDMQWDGFKFNPNNSNGEQYAFQKTAYPDLSAGINYAFFPNENVYLKLGVGLDHINRPKESFYRQENKIGFRPSGNLDLLIKLDDRWIAQLSGYYTQQKSASEIVYGAKVSSNVAAQFNVPTVLSLGLYNRFGDALIPVVGLEWYKVSLMASADINISGLSKATAGTGAFEISLIYHGLYGSSRGKDRGGYNCPRF